MTIRGVPVIALPGVPSEMMAIYETIVEPRLLQMGLSGGVLVQRKINCFGAGESAVEEKLFDLTRRGHVPEVGITASDATISLRIFARAATRSEALRQIEPVEAIIRERLGTWVYGVQDEELQHIVLRLLEEKRQSIATAESVTAGLAAHRLAQVPGASNWLRGGVVAYTDEAKAHVLGVPRELLLQHTAVSAPVAEAMAVRVRELFHSDVAVSTTGYAGPTGGGPDQPVGLVYVGLAWANGSRAFNYSWGGTRAEIQSRTAKMALNVVRLHLLGH
jgi:nicotinamide-nucleotide amidase